MTLTVGSLFAGLGGLDLGLEMAGMDVKWQVEIDDYATRLLEHNWPHVMRFRDVRECHGGNLESVDVVAGGFPCQDISHAGKRVGIDGERSGLWSEFARLVGELRPRYVLVENVSALLGRGLGRVLGDLAEIGYDAEWDCIPAAAVGAPHIRDRVFILAYPRCESGGVRPPIINGCDDVVEQRAFGDEEIGGEDRKLVALVPGVHPGISEDWWRAQSRMDRSAHGVPYRMERLRTLGNAVVPQVGEWVGRLIIADAQYVLNEVAS